MLIARTALLALAVLVAAPAAAGAQAPVVRLAAASDCPVHPSCIPGFKRVYRMDPTPEYVKLAVADGGIEALDDGLAEVALAFSSNPELSRPDILPLRDDKHMIPPDHVLPVVRGSLLRRYGAGLRRTLNGASAVLNTLALRGLNQEVIDGRLPEAVGGEFADSNGLDRGARRKRGPRIVIGYMSFAENKTLAYMYAEALRGSGYRVKVRASGLRPATVHTMKAGRIGMWADYSGSLRGYLGGKRLVRSLARIHARPLNPSPAQDRNGFAMKRDVAAQLGVTKLSDIARYWPMSAHSSALRRLAADPLQSEQWAFSPKSVLDLPSAWQLSQGAGVTVAVVDTGAKLDHPDLAPNIWTNFGEIPDNGVDDDHNGYVDDVQGVDLTSTSARQDLSDGHGHGTHVAGIIAAARNGRGVVGVAPKARLMIVKVMNAKGEGTTGAVAEGIRYAAANGARVINVSIQGNDPDPRMNDAIAAAAAANALVVVAAGNSSRDIDSQPSYPAAIPAPNLVAVAATSPDTGKALNSGSNFGRLDVQLAAPGENILSTANTGGYVYLTGTSMAAPMVSGVAALVAALNPNLSAQDLRAVLLQNATRSRLPISAGYVDALGSVRAAATAVGYDTTQAPRLRVLAATAKRGRIEVRAAVSGSTRAIRRYRVTLDGRPMAQLAARPSPFSVTLRHRARRVGIQALGNGGRPLAAASRNVTGLRSGKRGVNSGHGVGT
jgi:subtilisin family serine protease